MSDDSIHLANHDQSWAKLAAEEIDRIKLLFSRSVLLRIEHVGSTAVPGIKAKPIIDINLLVSSIDEAKATIGAIKELGYQYWEENPDGLKMYFVKGMPPFGTRRTHHIWIYEDQLDFENRVLFRDYLITHPERAFQYENLKVDLAKKLSTDREAYTNAKTDFISETLKMARK